MAFRVKLMPRAERDLAAIFRRIGAGSSDAAHDWYLRLRDAVASLGVNPYRCPTTTEDTHFRHLLYGKKPHVYRVIYHIAEKQKEVVVVHVRHGARAQFKLGQL